MRRDFWTPLVFCAVTASSCQLGFLRAMAVTQCFLGSHADKTFRSPSWSVEHICAEGPGRERVK